MLHDKSSLHQHLSDAIGTYPRIITTVRNPRQRLYSHIKHTAMLGASIERINKMIIKKNSEYYSKYSKIFKILKKNIDLSKK